MGEAGLPSCPGFLVHNLGNTYFGATGPFPHAFRVTLTFLAHYDGKGFRGKWLLGSWLRLEIVKYGEKPKYHCFFLGCKLR